MPRAPSSTKTAKKGKGAAAGGGAGSARHDPLHAQLRQDELVAKYGTVSAPGRRPHKKVGDAGEADADGNAIGAALAAAAGPKASSMISGSKSAGSLQRSTYIDPRLSRNILRLAREQQDEMEQELGIDSRAASGSASTSKASKLSKIRDSTADMPEDDDDDDAMGHPGGARADEEDGGDDDDDDDFPEDAGEDEEVYEELEIDPSDTQLLARLGAGDDDDDEHELGDGPSRARGAGAKGGNLADMILAKIAEADESGGKVTFKAGSLEEPVERPMPPGINPKIIEVYTKVGELLSRYKSGPLPKAFKIVPSLPSWETVLYITNPETWTPHATYAATKIFVSNLKASQTQRFFELVLLDKFRDEIRDKGKTSYQIYEALKKGLYKPAAFFKGLLFPLCESGTLTLKEAAILASVLTKVSIPVLHSAAALLRLAEMEYTGPTSLLIRVLLDKKYALPYKVVDALVFHFLKFAQEGSGVEVDRSGLETGGQAGERRMPVLWHQSLLVFAQRYKQDLTPDQKAALVDLLRVQTHPGISPEVRRELTTGAARGEMLDEPMDDDADSYDGVSDIMSV
ncbi:snoRNA-binding rRNA-processing protein [Tilletia horrida]|nr:snoRNA-binding rRNA-processing protein [Tilletia horrida]